MTDQREHFDDPEEAFRSAWAGVRSHMYTSLPAIVAEDSDGHTVKLQVAIKQQISDRDYEDTQYRDYPLLVDVPVHHPGGGTATATFPIKKGDEILALFSSRSIDAWHQSGGTQQPIFNRYHSLSDAMAIPGWRSIPRALKQLATDTAQTRSDDKKNVLDFDPATGTHIKSTDPSAAPASESFDPFTQAASFFESFVKGAIGIHHGAVNGGTAHAYDLTHAAGHVMAVLNGLHSVTAHPSEGAALNADNLLHKVLAHPDLGALLSAAGGQHMVQAHPENGVMISSSSAVSISAPSLSLPPGSISAEALDPSALSGGVGALGGDLSGSLPNPQVVGIRHVVGANLLPNAANDTAAAGLGVIVGALYRNGSVLCVRVT